ncbi:MAG: 50S ribosomal protein L22 [Planctomycetia bacterium]|nr:50S ribosomal protein L22 [Planctomycetia bacterium]
MSSENVLEEKLYSAIYRHAPISAQKVRYFADLIRSMKADQAAEQLQFFPNRGAKMLEKVLRSAMGNAADLGDPDPESLDIFEVRIDGGPMQKRWRPKSRGMSTIVKKRTSHITVVLGRIID